MVLLRNGKHRRQARRHQKTEQRLLTTSVHSSSLSLEPPSSPNHASSSATSSATASASAYPVYVQAVPQVDPQAEYLVTKVPPSPSWLELFVLLVKRCWTIQARMPFLLKANAAQTGMLAMLVGLSFLGIDNDQSSVQNRLGAIYFLLVTQMFSNAFGVVLTFPEERAVFLREQSNNMYPVSAYFLAKVLIILPWLVTISFLFCSIVYPMMGLAPGASHFFKFVVSVTLVALSGQAFGLVVACSVPTRILAVTLAPLCIAPFILFTPYALPGGRFPVIFKPLQYISPFWWGFNALTINEFAGLSLACLPGQEIEVPRIAGDGRQVICQYLTGEQVLRQYGIDDGEFGLSVGMLILISVFFRGLAFVILRHFSRRVQPNGLV